MSRNIIPLAAILCSSAFACQSQDLSQDDQDDIGKMTQAFTESTGATVALTAPFVRQPPVQAAEGESDPGLAAPIEGPGFVTDPSCISTSWQNLRLAAEFDQCELSATGSILDGGASIGLTVNPWGIDVAFAQLSLDDASIDGSLGVYATGTLQQPTFGVNANITVARASTQSRASLSGLSVAADPSGLTASGQVDIDTPNSSASGAFASVHWDPGLCLPVAGTLSFDYFGAPVDVQFQPNTPYDGEVLVTVNGGIALQMKLLTPCSTEPTQA